MLKNKEKMSNSKIHSKNFFNFRCPCRSPSKLINLPKALERILSLCYNEHKIIRSQTKSKILTKMGG